MIPKELLQELINKPPVDEGGPTAIRGFQFQTSFALDLIVKIHGESDDYVFVLDHHDDLVVVTSAGRSFYQIKSTTAQKLAWSELLDKGSSKHSYLSRLYYNAVAFPEAISKCVLICNKPFSVTLKDKKKPELVESFSIIELSKEARSKYSEHVYEINKEAIELLQRSPWIPFHTHCQRTDLSLQKHESDALGRILHWLESLGYHSGEDAKSFYRALRQEILRRSEKSLNTGDSALAKCLSRQQIEALLQQLCKHSHRAIRDRVCAIIDKSFPPIYALGAKKFIDEYAVVDLPNPTMNRLLEFPDAVSQVLNQRQLSLDNVENFFELTVAIEDLLPPALLVTIPDEKRRRPIILYEVFRAKEIGQPSETR